MGIKLHVAWRDKPTRRGFSLIDSEGERAITVIGERLAPTHKDNLEWNILKKMDGIFITASDSEIFKMARLASISAPLRDRFGISQKIELYTYDELKQIIVNFSRLINLNLEDEASYDLAKISRGTPRIALRLLRRVRDYAQVVKKTNKISVNLIKKALNSYQIDEKGLDALDRQYLSFLNQNNNIPTGLDSIAAGLGDDSSMLEFVVEPYLIQIGFLTRTPRGRLLTALGKKYIDSKNDNF